MDDNQIIDLFFARKEEAIEYTARRYGPRLYQLAHRLLKDGQETEECVSDTYFKAWQTIPPQRPGHFFAYLSKICRNCALNRLDWKTAAKRSAQVVALTNEMEQCIPDESRMREMEGKELGRLLDAFLRKESAENRMVFLRRYWYVDTIGEIAERYGISESAVNMRLNRTRQRLKRYLEKEGIRV